MRANRLDERSTGVVTLRVNDVSREQLIVNFYPGGTGRTCPPGGRSTVVRTPLIDGRFRATFIVPKDISYADTTGRGRLVAYYPGAAGDGAGFTGMCGSAGPIPRGRERR